MSREVARREPEVPGALAALGVRMQEQDGYRVVAFPPELRDKVNILLPVQEIAATDPNFTPSLRMVQLDVETHSYEQGRGKRALSKQGLEVLASGAGILRTITKRIPRAELDDGEVGYEARVQIRRSDGSIEEIRREKIVSWDVEKFKVREATESAAKKWDWTQEKFEAELRKRTLTEREWLHAKCESKAVLRALRSALQIPHTFTPEQLQKPFLVVGYAFTPNYDDPMIKRMLVEHGLAATSSVYGNPSEPPAALDLPPESQRNLDRRVIAPAREPDDDDEPVGEARPDPTDGRAAAPGEPPEHDPTPNPPPAREPEPPPAGWQPPAYPHGEPEPEPEPVQPPLEPQPQPEALARADAGRVKIGFGRHKGKTIEQIDAEDAGYVGWLARNATDPKVKRAAEEWSNG